MVEITIQVPEALAERIAEVRDRLPEVLAVGLRDLPPLPTEGIATFWNSWQVTLRHKRLWISICSPPCRHERVSC